MLVVVGGHTRNIGKTSVAAGLIAALSEYNWSAFKITQHGHHVCGGVAPCECAQDMAGPYMIVEETGNNPAGDSSRFLAAGARRAFWVRTAAGKLGHALPALRRLFEESGNAICESNSLLRFIEPDLYIAVLDFGVEDFKTSARRALDRADALVVITRGLAAPAWKGVAPRLWRDKLRFDVTPPCYVSPELAEFVASHLMRC
ncbi:MAG: hypothetical protein IPM24_12625 [Bryobacterales bacterium]|nr:hypothetical protein [Bryobacterales bacterium]